MSQTPIKVLAVYDGPSGVHDAYFHRVRSLLNVVKDKGVSYEEAFLFDMQYKRPALRRLKNEGELREIIVKGGFDVIHAANNVATATAVLAARGTKAKVLFDAHGDVIAESKDRFKATRSRRDLVDVLQAPTLEKRALSGCDRMLVVSTPLKEHYQSKGVPADKMSLVRNGVDVQAFPPMEIPASRPFIIGYAGAMQVWQGLELLLEAISRISNPDLRFLIMGFTPEDEAWKQKFQSRVGDRVELIDRGSREQMIANLQRTHACVIPRLPSQTVKVAMPTKFGEYLAMGRPVVVTEVDETSRFVRDWNCGLVAQPTPESLSGAFEQMAQKPLEELKRMACQGRKFAEDEFTWARIGEEYYRALQMLAQQ